MINLIVYLIVVFAAIGVGWWILDYVPVPEPLNKIAKVVLIVIGLIVVIYILMALVGHAPSIPT